MTEDQIKAIAEEYIKDVFGSKIELEFADDVIHFLSWLSTRYCIVEREKVMKALKAWDYLSDYHPKISERRTAKTVANTFKDLFGTSMFNQNKAQYTAQCKTCMRKLAGEVLEVCKDATDENRHCQWNVGKDFCAYKIFWDRYTEAHWQTILTPEQFAKAKSLNQDEE